MQQCSTASSNHSIQITGCDIMRAIIFLVLGLAWASIPAVMAVGGLSISVLLGARMLVNAETALIFAGLAGLSLLAGDQFSISSWLTALTTLPLIIATIGLAPSIEETRGLAVVRLLIQLIPALLALSFSVLGFSLSAFTLGVLLVALSVLALFVTDQTKGEPDLAANK